MARVRLGWLMVVVVAGALGSPALAQEAERPTPPPEAATDAGNWGFLPYTMPPQLALSDAQKAKLRALEDRHLQQLRALEDRFASELRDRQARERAALVAEFGG
jgi:Spy/CpxP family protein refolding chaperone